MDVKIKETEWTELVTRYCEHGNEPVGSNEDVGCVYLPNNLWLLREDGAN